MPIDSRADGHIDRMLHSGRKLLDALPPGDRHRPAAEQIVFRLQVLAQAVDAARIVKATVKLLPLSPINLPEPPAGMAPVDCWPV